MVQCALGEADEETEINVRPGSMSSLLPSSDFGKGWSDRLREAESETISVRRLEGLFADAVAGIDEPRVYLKLDTQGFDLQAFAGAGESLKQIAGLQSEVSCVPIYDHMPRLPEQIAAYEAEASRSPGCSRSPGTDRPWGDRVRRDDGPRRKRCAARPERSDVGGRSL